MGGLCQDEAEHLSPQQSPGSRNSLKWVLNRRSVNFYDEYRFTEGDADALGEE